MDDIKDEILRLAVQAAVKAIVAKIPFFGLSFINPILGWVVGWVGGFLYDEMSLLISMGLIDLKVDHEVKGYEESVAVLKDAISKGNEDEIQKARDEAKKKLHDLISFKPS